MIRKVAELVGLLGTMLCGIALTSAAGVGEAQQATFRTKVDLVRIPVTALDAGGQPVRGLRASDFVVFEDGREREIAVFEEVQTDYKPGSLPLRVAQDVADNSWASPDLMVALLVDELVPRDRLPTVQKLAKKIVEAVPDGVPIAVLAPSDTAEVEVTTDRARIMARIDNIEEIARRVVFRKPRVVKTETSDCQWNKIAAAARALQSAATVRRKVLVYVSPFCSASYLEDEDSREAARAMQKANVSFLSVDPRGVAGYSLGNFPPPNLVGMKGNEGIESARRAQMTRSWDPVLNSQKSMIEFAGVTGGTALTNRDDLDSAVPQAIRDLGSYYLLGFYPDEAETLYRSLDIRSRRPGVSLRFQRNHEVGRRGVEAEPTSITTFTSSVVPSGGVSIRAFAASVPTASGHPMLTLTVEAPSSAFSAPGRVDAIVQAVDLWKEKVTKSAALKYAGLDATSTKSIFAGNVALAEGNYQLRFALFERQTGKGASVYLAFDVAPAPKKGEIALGSLVLARLRGSDGVVTLDREFKAQDVIRVRAQAGGRVEQGRSLRATLEISDAGGRVVRTQRVPANLEEGVYRFQADIQFEGLAPGYYKLKLSIAGVAGNEAAVGIRLGR